MDWTRRLHVETTDYIAKDGVVPGVADGSQLLTKAFAVSKGAEPESVSTGDGFAVFQVADIRAAHAPEFAAYREHILTDYREQQVPQMLSDRLRKLDDRAKALGDLRKAAAEMNIPVKTSDLVGKDGQAEVAFALPKGGISGPINEGRVGIVLSVLDKQEPTAEEIAKNFAGTREQLLSTQHDEIFRIYLGTLADKYQKSGAIRYSKKPAGPGAPGAPVGS